jgi:uncharacterized PurR-regulated membrane protein YhhQ (DUF165 family)
MGILITPMRPLATKKIKIMTWIARVIALVLLIVLFVVTIKEFYSAEDPSKVTFTGFYTKLTFLIYLFSYLFIILDLSKL